MKKIKIFFTLLGSVAFLGFQSCLDYDIPTDDFDQTEIKVDDTIYHGAADSIDYMKSISEEGLDAAIQALNTSFRQARGGIYAMRGGKEGQVPGAHSYQRQFSLGPDNYAQYSVVPHSDFMYGELRHIYAVSPDFNPGPFSCYEISKNVFVPLLNRPEIDSIPEMKAIFLLLFNYASQEIADLYGPFPYVDFKANKQSAPFTYNDLRTIYVNIKANVDTVLKCLHYFDQKPEWYKSKVKGQMSQHLSDLSMMKATNVETWIRFANSFKLRMAMHIVKVDRPMAKEWAEEAVRDGVIESTDDEIGLRPMYLGMTHPLLEITNTWGDSRLSASFESLLKSLNHPYADYVFEKNGNAFVNKTTEEVTPANTRIVGMREGVTPGTGQAAASNPYAGCSKLSAQVFAGYAPPLYLMKMSEVDFLRAEGHLYGWDMGGSESFFYNRGLDNAYLEDRDMKMASTYVTRLEEYKNLEAPVAYTYVDPQGIVDDMPSVTQIGVKWNEGDSPEVKLEKIITQKYIAAYPYSYEPWVDMRRTGYPKVFPVINPGNGDGSLSEGDLIRRMPFPNTDDASIRDIQATGLKALGGADLQATRLWWDVDQPNF